MAGHVQFSIDTAYAAPMHRAMLRRLVGNRTSRNALDWTIHGQLPWGTAKHADT